jgi:hypothetical protein
MYRNEVAAIDALKTLGTGASLALKTIALVGLDDFTLCRLAQPSLTTIQYSPRELRLLRDHNAFLLGAIFSGVVEHRS